MLDPNPGGPKTYGSGFTTLDGAFKKNFTIIKGERDPIKQIHEGLKQK